MYDIKKIVLCVYYTSVDQCIVNNEHASLIEKRDVFYIFLQVLSLRVLRQAQANIVANNIQMNASTYI